VALACGAVATAYRGAIVGRSNAASTTDIGFVSGVMVLDSGATSGALSMNGNARMKAPAIYVNSSSNSAVQVSHNTVLDTPNLYLLNAASLGSSLTGTSRTFPGPALDPYSGMSLPATDTAHDLHTLSINGGTQTISPGYYSGGMSFGGNAIVTLNPGVYVLGNGISTNNATIRGDGVCLVILGGRVNIGGNAIVNLTPPTSGNMIGVVIAQPASNTNAVSLAGGSSMVVHGTIWAPGAAASLGGNASASETGPIMGDMVIVKTLSLSGSGSLNIGGQSRNIVQPQVSGQYD